MASDAISFWLACTTLISSFIWTDSFSGSKGLYKPFPMYSEKFNFTLHIYLPSAAPSKKHISETSPIFGLNFFSFSSMSRIWEVRVKPA